MQSEDRAQRAEVGVRTAETSLTLNYATFAMHFSFSVLRYAILTFFTPTAS